jgi:hypothetical protein
MSRYIVSTAISMAFFISCRSCICTYVTYGQKAKGQQQQQGCVITLSAQPSPWRFSSAAAHASARTSPTARKQKGSSSSREDVSLHCQHNHLHGILNAMAFLISCRSCICTCITCGQSHTTAAAAAGQHGHLHGVLHQLPLVHLPYITCN